MSNRIIILTNDTSGSIPHPDYLDVGELAFNSADNRLFTKNKFGQIVWLNNFTDTTGSGYTSAFPFTGSAVISGSALITGSLQIMSGSIISKGETPSFIIENATVSGTFRADSTVSVGSVSNTTVGFLQNNVIAWYIDTSKRLLPNANDSYDIGDSSLRVRTIWTRVISSSFPIASASNALTSSHAFASNASISSSFASSAISSSYSRMTLSASYALNGGGSSTPTFPFTGSAIISGSLFLTGSGGITIQNATNPTLLIQGSGGTGSFSIASDVRIGADSNTILGFIQNNSVAWYIDTNKHLIPNVNNSYDIGTNSTRVRNLYATSITSSNVAAGIIAGTGTALIVSKSLSVQTIIERGTITNSAPPTTLNYNIVNGAILFHSASTSANWTLNFRGDASTTLNSIMNTGESISVALMVLNDATPYSASAYQVDGASITPRWQNGTIPTANANSIDAHTYTIMKTGNAQYILLASLTQFT